MLFRNIPFLRIGLPLAAGIVWTDTRPEHTYLPYLPIALCVMWLLLESLVTRRYDFRYAWSFGLVQQVCFFALGVAIVLGYDERRAGDFFPKLVDIKEGPMEVIGVLADVPTPGKKLKVPLRVHLVKRDTQWLPASGQVMCMIDMDSTLESTLQYGTQVHLKARISPVSAPSNPHTFDYGYYLHHQNIHHNAFVKAGQLQVVSHGHGNAWMRWAYHWRTQLLALLKKHFPTRDEYAVASALLVGYKADLSDELKAAYAETGSMHALAVSGTHVGLLYAGIIYLLNLVPLYSRRSRLVQYALVLVAIWAFTFLTGASASVLRAAVMFSFFLFGQIILRPTNTWNVLFASIFVLLLFNPYLLYDAGFQLSYAAVAGIVFFYPRIWKVIPLMPFRIVNEGMKVFAVGVAAQLGTLPLSLYYFHQFPCYFWLAGWVVVLGGAIFMGAGSALIILDSIWSQGAHWLGVMLYWKLWFINRAITWIQGLPGSVWTGIWLEPLAVWLMYTVLILVAVTMVRRRVGWLLLAMSGTFVVLALQGWGRIQTAEQAEFRIYHVQKGSLADFNYGGVTLTWGEQDLTPQRINMVAQGHRWALRSNALIRMDFGQDSTWDTGAYWHPILQVHNFRIAIINTPSDLRHPAIDVDAIWLRNNVDTKLTDCMRVFPAKVLIADGSSDWKRREQWRKEAKQANMAWHDTSTEGSWATCIE
jgi:competence protein ComEC